MGTTPGPGVHPLALGSLDFQTITSPFSASFLICPAVQTWHMGTPSLHFPYLLPALKRMQTYVSDNTVKSNNSPRAPKSSKLLSALPLTLYRARLSRPHPGSSPSSCNQMSARSSCFKKCWGSRYQPLPTLFPEEGTAKEQRTLSRGWGTENGTQNSPRSNPSRASFGFPCGKPTSQ